MESSSEARPRMEEAIVAAADNPPVNAIWTPEEKNGSMKPIHIWTFIRTGENERTGGISRETIARTRVTLGGVWVIWSLLHHTSRASVVPGVCKGAGTNIFDYSWSQSFQLIPVKVLKSRSLVLRQVCCLLLIKLGVALHNTDGYCAIVKGNKPRPASLIYWRSNQTRRMWKSKSWYLAAPQPRRRFPSLCQESTDCSSSSIPKLLCFLRYRSSCGCWGTLWTWVHITFHIELDSKGKPTSLLDARSHQRDSQNKLPQKSSQRPNCLRSLLLLACQRCYCLEKEWMWLLSVQRQRHHILLHVSGGGRQSLLESMGKELICRGRKTFTMLLTTFQEALSGLRAMKSV